MLPPHNLRGPGFSTLNPRPLYLLLVRFFSSLPPAESARARTRAHAGTPLHRFYLGAFKARWRSCCQHLGQLSAALTPNGTFEFFLDVLFIGFIEVSRA